MVRFDHGQVVGHVDHGQFRPMIAIKKNIKTIYVKYYMIMLYYLILERDRFIIEICILNSIYSS